MDRTLDFPRIWLPPWFTHENRVHAYRGGNMGGVNGGFAEFEGVGSQLYGPNSVVVPTPPIAGYTMYTFANAGVFQNVAGTTPATADGDVVGYWADQSGNNNHIVAAADNTTRATLKLNLQNGYGGLRFDGSNDLMFATITAGPPYTAFFVVKRVDAGTGAQGMVQFNNSPSQVYNWPATSDLIGWQGRSNWELDITGADVQNQFTAIGVRNKTNDQECKSRSAAATVSGAQASGTGVATAYFQIGVSATSFGNIDLLSCLYYPLDIVNADMDTILAWYATTVFAF